ncbi:hypothetical protein AB1Y20_000326 [Prymnesium parvum]|uniref:Uncharacterized protein n=1 Tax=Prymnesium parvum TaxID=97485 RepID=A0AB34KA49_PRYPA
MCHDDFFWEVNDLLESSYQAKRLEAEENSLLWWFVDFERVAVRDAPSPSAKMVGVLRQGALVQAEKLELIDPADGRPCARWLKLHKNEHQFCKSTTGALHLLVDGQLVGLGKLLRAASPAIDWTGLSLLPPQLRADPAAKLLAGGADASPAADCLPDGHLRRIPSIPSEVAPYIASRAESAATSGKPPQLTGSINGLVNFVPSSISTS